jgi:hypothetical protein
MPEVWGRKMPKKWQEARLKNGLGKGCLMA